jgi:hypothetical protein
MDKPTEAEVLAAYGVVTRMVSAFFDEIRAGERTYDDEDLPGIIESKRQVLRYAIQRFDGDVYERFTKDE